MKIKYHKTAEVGDLDREELAAVGFWHRICALLGIVIALAAAVGYYGGGPEMELGSSAPAGFACWFLLCCAYPVLGVLGLVNMFFGTHDTEFMRYVTQENQVAGVFLIDIVSLAVIWLAGRWAGIRAIGAEKLRIAANFLAILAGWGILQLLLFGAVTIWGKGGFDPLHRNLNSVRPEKVTAVSTGFKST